MSNKSPHVLYVVFCHLDGAVLDGSICISGKVGKNEDVSPEKAALQQRPEEATVSGHCTVVRAQRQVVALRRPDDC